MLDFKEEIFKYAPVLEMDEVGEAAQADELKDVMDLLQRVTDQLISNSKERSDELP